MNHKDQWAEQIEDLQVKAYEKGLEDKSAEFIDVCNVQLKILTDQHGSKMARNITTTLRSRAEKYFNRLLTFPAYRIRQFKEEAESLSAKIGTGPTREMDNAREEE